MCFMFEVFAAVSELTAGGVLEKKARVRFEAICRKVGLYGDQSISCGTRKPSQMR